MKKLVIALLFALSTQLISAQNPYVIEKKSEQPKVDLALSSEQTFIAENFPFIHMADWTKGMRFMVEQRYSTDSDNPAITSKLDLKPLKKRSTEILQKDFEYKIFTVERLEERQVSCPRGRCPRTYIIMNCEGSEYEYEYIGSRDEMRKSNVFTTIKKLIYLDDIDRAKQLLIDKHLYIIRNIYSIHPRFIPVTITNIGIDRSNEPVKIVYTTDAGKEYTTSVVLSGTNVSIKLDRDFSKIFSFDDPRQLYPKISDNTWELIQNSKVSIGMTEKECELSWGKPEKINTSINGTGVLKQWVYPSSSYLYFEGGKLSSIQD